MRSRESLGAQTPLIVPVLLLNLSASMPRFWSMDTKRLATGVLFVVSKARCWPCLKPPPARMSGRFWLLWELALPRQLP